MMWEKVRLGESVSISKGKKHNPVSDGKYRYINIEDLHNPNNLVFTNESGQFASKNDVIIAWDGANAGKVGIGLNGVIGSTLAKMELKIQNLDASFLFWFLESKNGLIKSQRTGATIPHVNGSALKELQIPLPPLPIQKRIAEILDTADALRRKDEALLKKYDELAQAIFIDMFEKNKNTVKLNEITTKITDGVHAKPNYQETGIPFLSVKNATKKFLDFSDIKYISEIDHKEYTKRCKPEFDDILYTKVGATYGRAAIVDTEKEFSIYVSLALIKPNKSLVYPFYLNFVLNSDFVKRQADRRIKGAGVPDLHLVEIKDFDIPLPSFDKQLEFSNIIENLNKNTLNVKIQIEKSTNLFNSLLQKAFNGELIV